MTTRDVPSERAQPGNHHAAHDDLFGDEAGNVGGASVPDCQTCGACCSYSDEWPRFTMESDEALDLIPQQFVAADQRGMRCDGGRCSALSGSVGKRTACVIYDVRPDVCRACVAGDYACRTARAAFGLE